MLNKHTAYKLSSITAGLILAGLLGYKTFKPDIDRLLAKRFVLPSNTVTEATKPLSLVKPEEAWNPAPSSLSKKPKQNYQPIDIKIGNLQLKAQFLRTSLTEQELKKDALVLLKIEPEEKVTKEANEETKPAPSFDTLTDLTPLKVYYNNWEEDPELIPKITESGAILLSSKRKGDSKSVPPNKAIHPIEKTPTRLYLLYKIPPEFIGSEITLTGKFKKSHRNLNDNNSISPPNKAQINNSEKIVTASFRTITTTGELKRWYPSIPVPTPKYSQDPQNPQDSNIEETWKINLEPRKGTAFLLTKFQTSGTTKILVDPTIQVTKIKKPNLNN